MSVKDIYKILFKRINDGRGNICFFEGQKEVPFDIKRIYYLHGIPSGETRGAHAHRNLHQVIIAINGSFEIKLFDGENWFHENLTQPNVGLYIPPGLWRDLSNFSKDAVCLVVASEAYCESDYIRDIEEFKAYAHKKRYKIS